MSGRRPGVSDMDISAQRRRARALYAGGARKCAIARLFGISWRTAHRWMS